MSDLQDVISALASPVRREILSMVWVEALPAGEIAGAFELTAATVSQHLSVLRDAGLVSMTVDGNFRRYRANQTAMRGLDAALFEPPTKWTPADDLPESELAQVDAVDLVHAYIEVDCPIERVFAGFTEPAIYSTWMGVPVRIHNGRFSCDLEWGTKIRGWYDHVVAPSLIALRWNFSDTSIPVPGNELIAYMRFSDISTNAATATDHVPAHTASHATRIDVHQVIDDPAHVHFMQTAWAMVLGRCALGIVAATDANAESESVPATRTPRPKRSTPR